MRVSVVIPCYNAGRYLGEAIRSALGQTCPPCEIIVVDDGSDDDSAAIAGSFGDPVRVIRQPNQGECVARNTGLDAAQGDWIAFLDADDIWMPMKLECQVRQISRLSDLVCVHTGFHVFGIVTSVPPPPPDVIRQAYEVETLLVSPLINSSTAMVRAGLPVRFPDGVRQGGDMIFFTELSLFGTFAYVPRDLTGYRMHAAQVTRHPQAWPEHLQNRLNWLHRHIGDLGQARAQALENRLKKQILDWLDLARWNRQWDRYWGLREYAQTIDWGATKPAALNERLYPRWFYRVKDSCDALLARS